MSKTVYCYNEQNYFTRTYDCQPSPLEPGKYLMPPTTTDVAVPTLTDGQYAKWDGSKWNIENHTGKYIIKSGSNWDTIISSTYPPVVSFLDCPLAVTNTNDCDISGTTVTFNQPKHDARIAAETSAAQATATATATEVALRAAIKTRAAQYVTQIQSANVSGMANLADAKVILAGLQTVLTNLVTDLGTVLQRVI